MARSDKFSWGGAIWTILNPPKDQFGASESQAGNVSIVHLLEFNGKRLLFTGDIEPNVADSVNVFLMTHHGASRSSSKKLDEIRPWWVVISAGKDNDYHHPHKTPTFVTRPKGTTASSCRRAL